ncbi:SI1L3 protein, partial [Eudromia elegans]|nr:SI1L3 protein [Eudromia elegans]
FARGAELRCALGVSKAVVVLLDLATKEVVFNCGCADVLGWSADGDALKLFYGRGDHVLLRADEG